MFPFLCHLPSFPLGFYILLLAWYLPYPSVQHIPLSSFSWLTNEMLNLAMLLSLSFIAQLNFLHFSCYSSVITLLLLYLLLYAHHLTGISLVSCYSSLWSFPCPLLPSSPPPPTSFRFALPSSPSNTSLSYAQDPLSKSEQRTKALLPWESCPSGAGWILPVGSSLLINYTSLTRTEQLLDLQRVKCKKDEYHSCKLPGLWMLSVNTACASVVITMTDRTVI